MIIYVYIKQHQITNLKYFGRTIQNPEKYIGSGTHWKRHLKIHGKFIDTLCLWEFEDQNSCSQFCINFSIENDIVKSKQWANEIEENGLAGGGVKGRKDSIETINRKRESNKGQIPWNKDKKLSESDKKNKSLALKGRIYVTNGEINKQIYSHQLITLIGFWPGRSFDGHKGKIHITNHKISKMIKPSELDYYSSLGFIRGRKKLTRMTELSHSSTMTFS